MRLPPGLDILEEREGSGPPAEAGSTVVYNVRIFLNRGDEVPMNPSRPEATGEGIRRVDGEAFADHVTTLGRRQAIAGIEKALVGMRVGGWRRIRVGAHLAYGSRGVEGRIPPDAVLTIELWLREIVPPRRRTPS
jgi:FKBP-type peptidyl-prolyl cis-trans isomerase (trigger factor)